MTGRFLAQQTRQQCIVSEMRRVKVGLYDRFASETESAGGAGAAAVSGYTGAAGCGGGGVARLREFQALELDAAGGDLGEVVMSLLGKPGGRAPAEVGSHSPGFQD